jgi:hypothetical protein
MLALLIVLALQLSLAEFHDLRAADAPALRERFRLPAHCEPRLTAMLVEGRSGRIDLFIHCSAGRARLRSASGPPPVPQPIEVSASPAPPPTVHSDAGDGPWRPGYD